MLLLLKAVDETGDGLVGCALECTGDVRVDSDESTYVEEDKLYDSVEGFTIASPAIRQSLVGFVDTYIQRYPTKSLTLGIYATPGIAKERMVGVLKKFELPLPEEPIIQILQSKEFNDEKAIVVAKEVVLHEYKTAYKDTQGGYLEEISEWDLDQWKAFFEIIDWQLGADNLSRLEISIKDEIVKLDYFDPSMRDKIDIIKALLLEEFDRRQGSEDLVLRFVPVPTVETICLRVAGGRHKLEDPAWKLWKQIPEPLDQRGADEKLIDASPNLSKSYIERQRRRVSEGILTIKESDYDPSVRALRYRVYQACEEKIANDMRDGGFAFPDPKDFKSYIDQLVALASSHVEALGADYRYGLTNKHSIEAILMELIDSCYLSFTNQASEPPIESLEEG